MSGGVLGGWRFSISFSELPWCFGLFRVHRSAMFIAASILRLGVSCLWAVAGSVCGVALVVSFGLVVGVQGSEREAWPAW